VFGFSSDPINEECVTVTTTDFEAPRFSVPGPADNRWPPHAAGPTISSWPLRPAGPGGPRHAAADEPSFLPSTASTPGDREAAKAERARAAAFLAAEIKRAIQAKGLRLRQLEEVLESYGQHFSSGLGTLSDWQRGNRTPPATESGLNRVLALERALDVPAGDLAVHIPGDLASGSNRPLQQVAPQARPSQQTLHKRHRQIVEIINRISGSQLTIPVATTKTYALSHEYRPVHTIITSTIRAAHNQVDRYWFLHAPSATSHPTITKIAGCRIGRVLHEDEVLHRNTPIEDGDVKLVAVELLFDKMLDRGERYAITFSVGYNEDSAPPEDFFRHIQVQPCEQLDLRLEFQDPHYRPHQVRQSHWTTDLRLVSAREVDHAPDGTYELRMRNPLPGAYGWSWPATSTRVADTHH
jgi:transcriptional regulator with XRE-family HTH domain